MHQAPQQPDAHKAPGLVTEYYDFSFSTRASLGIALWSAVSKRLIACNSLFAFFVDRPPGTLATMTWPEVVQVERADLSVASEVNETSEKLQLVHRAMRDLALDVATVTGVILTMRNLPRSVVITCTPLPSMDGSQDVLWSIREIAAQNLKLFASLETDLSEFRRRYNLPLSELVAINPRRKRSSTRQRPETANQMQFVFRPNSAPAAVPPAVAQAVQAPTNAFSYQLPTSNNGPTFSVSSSGRPQSLPPNQHLQPMHWKAMGPPTVPSHAPLGASRSSEQLTHVNPSSIFGAQFVPLEPYSIRHSVGISEPDDLTTSVPLSDAGPTSLDQSMPLQSSVPLDAAMPQPQEFASWPEEIKQTFPELSGQPPSPSPHPHALALHSAPHHPHSPQGHPHSPQQLHHSVSLQPTQQPHHHLSPQAYPSSPLPPQYHQHSAPSPLPQYGRQSDQRT